MATINKFEGFDNKEDIFALIDKFDKSSLFELDISIIINKIPPSESEVRIKMMKTASARNNYWDTHRDIDEDGETSDAQQDNQEKSIIKMSKSEKPAKPDSAVGKQQSNAGGNVVIKAPLIGTFYAAPSPDSEPYVKVGDKVTKGMIVCIIEAMKVMNDIESDFDGEIAEILVKTGDAVEYGQPLFRLK